MGGEGPDEPPLEFSPCPELPLQYFAGHGDVYVAHQDGELSLMIRGSFDPDLPEESLYDPADVCIRLPEVASFTLPESSAFASTGVEPGAPFWLIPQVNEPGRVWLGTATYELNGAEFGAHSTLELLWNLSGVPDAGSVSLFINSTFGSPLYWITTKGESFVFSEHLNGSHTHMNWTFNQPGQYDLVFRASAKRVAGGATLRSEPTAFHFFVGDE